MADIRRQVDRAQGNRSESGDHITYEYGNDLINIHHTAIEDGKKKHIGIYGDR